MEAPLTQREFDTWRESDRDFKANMLAHIKDQQNLNLIMDRRVGTLELNRDNDKSQSAKWTTVIAAAVSAAIGGVFAYMKG